MSPPAGVTPSNNASPSTSECAPMHVLCVVLIDFDWAGMEGSAQYPHFLNPAVPWEWMLAP